MRTQPHSVVLSRGWLAIAPLVLCVGLLARCASPARERPAAGGPLAKEEKPRVVPAVGVEPRMSRLGSDVSDLPQRFATGVWLPIDAPVMSMENVVAVTVDGERTVATVDTGAMVTTLSRIRADALGMTAVSTGPSAREADVIDAHGKTVRGLRSAICPAWNRSTRFLHLQPRMRGFRHIHWIFGMQARFGLAWQAWWRFGAESIFW